VLILETEPTAARVQATSAQQEYYVLIEPPALAPKEIGIGGASQNAIRDNRVGYGWEYLDNQLDSVSLDSYLGGR